MFSLNVGKFKFPPFQHQKTGIVAMVTHPYFALFDEMGVGKSYQVINAACILYDAGIIDTVIIACPAQVKSVWLDPELGEIQKYVWVKSSVHHFKGPLITLDNHSLNWVIGSYELIRKEKHGDKLIKNIKGRKVMLVMDESIFLKNPKAAQTKQMYEMSLWCDRKYVLNGTPTGGNLLDLYCQFKMLNPMLLQCETYYQFRAKYAVMGGFHGKQVVSFKNEEEVTRLTAPYVLRRLKEDCLDLPKKLYTFIEVPLSKQNWTHYKSMRDNLVVWLESSACMVQHAPVKALRLGQITSGFLGGVADTDDESEFQLGFGFDLPIGEKRVEEIGREKLDLIMGWLEDKFEQNKNFRTLIWTRFRPELDRLESEIREHKWLRNVPVYSIRGGQSKSSRTTAKQQGEVGTGPTIILGQPHAGGFGLNLTSIANVVYLSQDYSLLARLQSEDRCHRPGQTKNVTYIDTIATGPEGQKTIDHAIIKALRKNQEMARWTSEQWRAAILEE
jgi:SNF2 family DNA or RNA helicase